MEGLKLLETTLLGSLFPDHPSDTLICFSKTNSIATVFKGLVEHGILSAPVYDPIRRSHNGFVDMVDIVAYFIDNFSEKELSDVDSIQNLLSTERCGKASDCSGRDPYLPVEGMACLLTAIVQMAKNGVHRIPVIDSEGQLMTVVTQSHVVKFLYHHMTKFGTLAHTSVEELGMVHTPVISVNINQKTLEAFKSMHENRISAVAVVHPSGTLIGNISVTDLKLIGYDGSLFTRLHYSVSNFMQLLQKDKSEQNEPIFVTLESSFVDVVSRLVNTRIHRVYIVDQKLAPVGVITQREVLQALLKFLNVN